MKKSVIIINGKKLAKDITRKFIIKHSAVNILIRTSAKNGGMWLWFYFAVIKFQ